MSHVTLIGSGWEFFIFIAIFFGIIIPLALFIIGLVKLRNDKKTGKIIIIIATIYSIISYGICGGFGL